MSKKNPLLLGTLLLTATSFISRFIGFFFRIFMSHTFGEEQIGLYQLVFPIYALCFSITSAGIQLALSRTVAKEISLGQKERATFFLYISLAFSFILSIVAMQLIRHNSAFLSIYILGDLRCENMLTTISYALPFASVHSCICGYYLGLKQAKITAYSQLVEQLTRVGSVFLLCYFLIPSSSSDNILYAFYGIIISEFIAAVFCIYYFSNQNRVSISKECVKQLPSFSKELLSLATPITANRVLTNLLQSVESISIPLSLQRYGLSNADALSTFGVLTGMALPCILFPSAITNSIATLVLPAVAEIQSQKNFEKLRSLLQKVLGICILLGSASCFLFFIFSNFIGGTIFNSPVTSNYLKVLCWICPFLYTNTTLASVINGLGRTNITFSINSLGLFIRIVAILIFIPKIGMNGYLWGLLFSQLLSFSLSLSYLIHFQKRAAS